MIAWPIAASLTTVPCHGPAMEIVARDEASAASRQKEDGVEDAPADGNDLPAAAELEALLVRLEAAEPRDHRRHAPITACRHGSAIAVGRSNRSPGTSTPS